jgi:Pyridoxamine 5'-phosphate oxidase
MTINPALAPLQLLGGAWDMELSEASFPTVIAGDGDSVLIHGSTGSAWMRQAAAGRPACVTVTDLSGIIVARSSFENSLRYRSAVLFGSSPGWPRQTCRARSTCLPSTSFRAGTPKSARCAAVNWPRRWCSACRSRTGR